MNKGIKMIRKAALGSVTAASLLITGNSQAALSVAETPLFLNTNALPNVMFILDDSGSMQWEIMPDDIMEARYMFPRVNDVYGGSDYGSTVPIFDEDPIGEGGETRGYSWAMRSSDTNKIYYNPEITYQPWSKGNGNLWDDADPEKAYHNPALPGKGTRDLTEYNDQWADWQRCDALNNCDGDSEEEKKFWPAVYYAYDGAGDVYDTSNYHKVKIEPATASYTDDGGNTDRSARTDCAAAPTCTYAEEIQNFANWYTYYRSRILLARAGVGAAFADQGTNLRVGFGAINKGGETIDGAWSSGTLVDGVRQFTGVDRENYFNSLYGYTLNAAGTPLRRSLDQAGQYFSRSAHSQSPWDTTPGDSSDTIQELSCRQSYSILMSDGYWTEGNAYDANTAGARANVDGNDGSLIVGTGYTYNAEDPYQDPWSNVLADVAMYYWNRDLRTDIENKVPTNQYDDTATWQHMTTFTVGLGVFGSLDYSDLPDLESGAKSWPNPTQDTTINGGPVTQEEAKIDDMFHAAVNSRGSFFSASNPNEFSTALSDVLKNIAEREGSAAAVAANSTRLSTDTLIFQARFNSGDWTGQMLAYPINTDGTVGSLEWDAGSPSVMPAEASRNIFTMRDDSNTGVAFEFANLSDAQKDLLDLDITGTDDGLGSDRLDYLRGDQSEEGANGGPFRNRTRTLGDVINSDPFYVYQDNFGYTILGDKIGGTAGVDYVNADEGNDYLTYRASSTYTNRLPMIYVGSNGGMLHGFLAMTNAAATAQSRTAGEEIMAYVPKSVYPILSNLTSPDYQHKFYVDGSPKVADAYITLQGGDSCEYTGGASGHCWRSILLGSTGVGGDVATGNGGKSVFALNVSDPANFDANDVMWEFTDSELGYTLGQPTIVRLDKNTGGTADNAGWYAIFGNGYNSTSGKAQLFVVDLSTGTLAARIDTGVGSTTSGQENGLAQPVPVDENGDRITDYVYAGDLYGNVWKFDFDADDGDTVWRIAHDSVGDGSGTPVPLFSACTSSSCANGERQPITSRPNVGRHPYGGVMVYFGTGKYFEDGDQVVPSNPQLQTFYSVWDRNNLGAVTNSRGALGAQTIDFEGTSGTTDYRVVSENQVSYAAPSATNDRGWYLDLALNASPVVPEGERVISSPILRFDRVIFATAIPSKDMCDFGGDGWLMEMDAISGARLSYAVIDVNGDGVVDNLDVINDGTDDQFVSGKRLDGIGDPGAIIRQGTIEYKYISTSSGTISVTTEQGETGDFGRQSWHLLSE